MELIQTKKSEVKLLSKPVTVHTLNSLSWTEYLMHSEVTAHT